MDSLDERMDNLLKQCQQLKAEIEKAKQLLNERIQIRIDFEKKLQELGIKE